MLSMVYSRPCLVIKEEGKAETSHPLILASIEQWYTDHDEDELLNTLHFLLNLESDDNVNKYMLENEEANAKEIEEWKNKIEMVQPLSPALFIGSVVNYLSPNEQLLRLSASVSAFPSSLMTRQGREYTILNMFQISHPPPFESGEINRMILEHRCNHQMLSELVRNSSLDPYMSHHEPSPLELSDQPLLMKIKVKKETLQEEKNEKSFKKVKKVTLQEERKSFQIDKSFQEEKKDSQKEEYKSSRSSHPKQNQNPWNYSISIVHTAHVLDSPHIKPSNKIAAFDMDHTLIVPKSVDDGVECVIFRGRDNFLGMPVVEGKELKNK